METNAGTSKRRYSRNAVAKLLYRYGRSILDSDGMQREKHFFQHGHTSCYDHSLAVARMAIFLALRFKIRVDMESMVRGALLHDYFLYDWHIEPKRKNGLHGFSHPFTAFYNALFDFDLSDVERDIITRHMFPLVPLIPRYKESCLVSIVDKLCSLYEVFSRSPYNLPEIRRAENLVLSQSLAKVAVI